MIGPVGSSVPIGRAAMGPVGASPAQRMEQITGRIAQIQARIAGMQPAGPAPLPVIDAPSTGTHTPSGYASAARVGPALPGLAGIGLAGQPITGAAPGSAAAGSASIAATPVPGTTAAALAARLPAQGQPLAVAIDRAAREAGVDPALFAAMVRHESNFDQSVVSHAGAIGLAQLMPGTADWLGVDPHDAQQNLAGGARYLREQLDRFGSPELAVAAYNAGPNRVAQAGGIPQIRETQVYVGRVMATWEEYR